jgi:hypothetical protein
MSSKKWNDPQRDAAQFTVGTAYRERGLHGLRGCARVVTIAGARMTISMNMVPEETIEECKRHVVECAALLERTSVPEYREAIIVMAKAWMRIAEQAKIKASR